MTVDYHNLSDRQFEDLVIEFCVELLGDGVQGFCSGKDGGRDARFVGTAKRLPNEISPWTGRVVIQAKHTELLNKGFSENDFSGDGEGSILGKELPRIKKLVEDGELDYYLLFSNRRLTGVTDQAVRQRIAKEAGIDVDHVRLYDDTELQRLEKRYPEAVDRADLNPAASPPDLDPRDLAEVIQALAQSRGEIDELLEGNTLPPTQRVSPKDKNRKNGLGEDFFNRRIRPRMVDFPAIQTFLADPINQPYVGLYEETAAELEDKIVAWSKPDAPYERLLITLIDRLLARDPHLRSQKQLTRAVVYYMYVHCDLGNSPDDQAQ